VSDVYGAPYKCTYLLSFFGFTALQTLLRKTDKRIRKLIDSLESRTLAVVLFSGGTRTDAEANQNAMCFVRVT